MVGRSNSLRSIRCQLLLSHYGCSTDVSTWYDNYVWPTDGTTIMFGQRKTTVRILGSDVLQAVFTNRCHSVFETAVAISVSISEHCGIYSLREVEYADLPTAVSSLLAHVVQYSAALL